MYSSWNFEALEKLKDTEYNESIAFHRFKNGEVTLEYILGNNYKLCFDFLKKYFLSIDLSFEEKLSIIMQGLIKAINTFDLSKGYTFSTLAYRIMYNNILMELRTMKKIGKVKTVSIDSKIKDDKQENNTIHIRDMLEDKETNVYKQVEDNNTIEQLKIYIDNLNKNQKDIIELRYICNKTQQEVAKIIGISQAQVCRLEKKAVNYLREQFSKVG